MKIPWLAGAKGAAPEPAPSREDPARNISCSEFEVDNWIISDFVVKRLIPVVGTHPFPIPELHLMVAAVCRLKPDLIFEWGTNIGKSARIFHETAQHFGLGTRIHSIDLPDGAEHREHPGSERGKLVRGLAGVTLHCGDGLATAVELHGKLGSGSPPLVFIDGDHEYASVRRELAGIIAGIPRANVLLHDTFYQSEASGYNVGPHRAVVDTLAAHPGRYRTMAAAAGLPGLTLLYRIER